MGFGDELPGGSPGKGAVGQTLSKQYRKLNSRLHRSAAHYGRSGHLHAATIAALMAEYGTQDVLDYGCGKCTLQDALGVAIRNFDPCILELATPPPPADIVACIEVLEHVEPDYLDAVLADLRRLTRRVLFATVATVPSTKQLHDGRNAHLIVQAESWWVERITASGFSTCAVARHDFGFYVTAV